MLTELYKIVWLHVRVGYVKLLLGITVAIDFLYLLDIYRYEQSGRSLEPALQAAGPSAEVFRNILMLLFFLAVIAPSFLSIFRVLIGSREIGGTEFWVSNRYVIFGQFVACLLLGFFYALATSMQEISGYRGWPLGTGFEFNSWLAGSMNYLLEHYLVLYSFLMQLLLSAGSQVLRTRLKKPEAILAYMTKVQLSDVRGEFYPIHDRRVLNFDVKMAPAIQFIRRELRRDLNRYQKAVPGTARAVDILEDARRASAARLRRHLAAASFPSEWNIRFFGNTVDAIAAVVAGGNGNKLVIASPYESSSEFQLLTKTKGVETESLSGGPGFFSQPTGLQIEQTAQQILDKLPADGKTIVLLSEICYATGLTVPVGAIMREVKHRSAEHGAQPPGFVIVGTLAMGNVEKPGVDCAGADGLCQGYVAAGHHWLFAPEPCAFAVGAHSGPETLKTPGILRSAVGVLGLHASLHCLETIGMEETRGRSLQLRDCFVKQVRSQFEIVGENTGLEPSLMLSVAPRAGLQWALGSARGLQVELYRHNINARVIPADPGPDWMRLCFPYFLEERHVARLSQFLLSAVKPEEHAIEARPAVPPAQGKAVSVAGE
jgi:hypothetical protein